jgi:uncharacterized membrane protein YeaQ/YmgE (transglycosylase-associated protein family)
MLVTVARCSSSCVITTAITQIPTGVLPVIERDLRARPVLMRLVMIATNFASFLVLLVAGVLAGAVLHYLVRYRLLEGFDGFVGKCIAGWVGAWLGSPVLGHWFEKVKISNIYLLPALIGAFAGAFIMVSTGKALAKAFAIHETTLGAPQQRKAA